jgi:hypothetical protein
MTPHEKKTVILYHSKCIDGFGAAYAAWKKLGEEAEYIPVSYGKPLPEKMEERDVIFVDFCPTAEQLEDFKKRAGSITILDHHHGVRDVATNYPGVFDVEHSGATISWSYFHPGEKTPELLTFIEDGDLYRYALPETEEIYSYLIVEPYDFESWDIIVKALETPEGKAKILSTAKAYNEYFLKLAELSVAGAKKVKFEGYEMGFGITHPVMAMKSHVGHELATKWPPVALVVSAHPDGFGVSIRGDGTVDVAAIARKYGGNGLKSSAGFFIPAGEPLPWEEIKE